MVANNHMDKGVTVIAIEGPPGSYKALCRNIECNEDSLKHIIKPIKQGGSIIQFLMKNIVSIADRHEKCSSHIFAKLDYLEQIQMFLISYYIVHPYFL